MELNDHQNELRTPPNGIIVSPPAVHQGVGDALRSVFAPTPSHLPNEIEELLQRLR